MRILTMMLCCVALAASHPVAQQAPDKSPATQSGSTPAAPVVSETLAAQVMLDRLGFSSGEIDGRPGSNVKHAITAFQQANGRQPSGTLDDATWQALRERAGNVPPLITYTVTDSDLAGPFVPNIPADLVEKAQLEALRYQDPLEALAERFHTSPELLKTVNPGLALKQAGERMLVPNVEPMELPVPAGSEPPAAGANRQPTAAKPTAQPKVTIYVTKSTSALTVEDESRHVIFHAPVTTGSEHDPLPVGNWKVDGVQRNPVFNYNPDLFWDADPQHSKAKIAAGPNNPVGVLWIDLSKPHYGIHGTPEPSNIGHVQSHGCVRLTNWDVMRVAQWARPGTVVVFRE